MSDRTEGRDGLSDLDGPSSDNGSSDCSEVFREAADASSSREAPSSSESLRPAKTFLKRF